MRIENHQGAGIKTDLASTGDAMKQTMSMLVTVIAIVGGSIGVEKVPPR